MTIIGIAVVGCIDDNVSPDSDVSPAASESASTEEIPSGADLTEVEPLVSDLLYDYDGVVNEILADPSVTEDEDNALVAEFLGLFEEDSDFAADMIETWQASAAEGVRLEPYSSDYPLAVSSLNGDLETISEDEVSFPVCAIVRAKELDADGQEQPGLPRLDHPGEGVVVRTEDGWRLQDIVVYYDHLQCEGGGQ